MDTYVLLDARGIVLQHLHSGKDAEATTDSLTGRPINSPGHALENIITDVLLPTFQQFRVKHVIAVWDGGNKYREILSGGTYKAQRRAREASPEMQQITKEAQQAALGLFKGLGITSVTVPSVEADDTIAWMVDRLPTNIVIHTVDRDLLALGSPRSDKLVSVCVKREWPEMFVDKGVRVPLRWVTLYKSLVGDTSDNYGGVKGFGPKSWEQLVLDYGYDNLHEFEEAVNGKGFADLRAVARAEPGQHPLIERILEGRVEWKTSWELAKFHPELVYSRDNAEKKFLLPKFVVRIPSAAKVQSVLEAHGCTHLLPDLLPYLPQQLLITADGSSEAEILADAKTLIAESPFVSIDWETHAPIHEPFLQAAKGRDHVDMLRSRLTGVGLTMGRNLEYTFYLSVGHKDTNNLSPSLIPQLMDLIPANKPKVIQNFLFESTVYKSQFGKTLDNCHDTKVMASHVDESESNGLKDLSKRLLNYTQIKYRDVIEKGKGMADYSAEHVFAYGADDPLVTAHLYELLKLQLMLEGTWDFVRENEFPAIYPLVDAYLQGVEIDWDELERIRAEDADVYEKQMARLRELLKEHNTEEAIRAGVQNLLAYEREVIDARLKVGELTEDEAAAEIAKMHLTLEERVTYRDWVRQDKPLKIALTPKQLSETAALLGLPEIPRGEDGKYLSKRPDINDWLDQLAACQARAPREYLPWVEAVLEARSLLCSSKKDDNNPGIARIKREMEAVQRAFLPESKKYVWTGTELNMDSPPQMQALLYGMLCLPARMRSFDVSESRAELDLEGALQANKDAILTALAEDAPQGTWQREALECLWAAKRADTRRKSFYTPYPLWKHPATGRVHAQINSVGTETRRMSGSSPNLMQLPKRDEGVKFRYCFLPSKGHDLIVSIDFAGEELRVGAGLSLDPAMLGCYIDAEILKTLPDWMLTQLGPALVNRFKTAELRDLHSQTAAGIAGISYEQFEQIRHDPNHPDAKKMKAIRGTAKTVNFGSQYGIGPSKLSRQLICDTETAREYLEAKKSAYHRFEAWREEKIKELHAKGYLQTLYGSYRHVFNKLWTSDEGMVGYIERAALNFLIQGLCADYLKVVLRCIHETRVLQRHQVHLIAPIHDELVFSCSSKNAADFICEVHSIMVQGIPGLPCPIWAEPSLGPNFGEQIEIGPWPTPALVEQAIDQALNRGEVQQAA